MTNHPTQVMHPREHPLMRPAARRLIGGSVAVIMLALIWTWVALTYPRTGHPMVSLTFLMTGLTTLILLWYEVRRTAISLYMVHLLAIFLFLVVAPFGQWQALGWPHRGVAAPMAGEVVVTNLLVIAWLGATRVGHLIGRAVPRPLARPFAQWFQRPLQRNRTYWAWFAAAAALAFLVAQGLFGAVTRAGAQVQTTATAEMVLISILVRSIPMFVLMTGALQIMRRRAARSDLFVIAIAFMLAAVVVANNPLAAPRFWTFAFLVGAIYSLRRHRGRSGLLLIVIVLVGLLASPIINEGRTATNLGAIDVAGAAQSPIEYLATSGDFDAYQNFVLVQRWIADDGGPWGQQILGPAFFFVPRAIWDDKPVGTGHAVADHFGMPNPNIAAPLPAEGFASFGLAGLLIMALVIGYAFGRLDRWYQIVAGGPPRLAHVIYPIWCGMVLFMTRGDLMSSWAYVVLMTAPALLLFGVRWLPARRHAAPIHHDAKEGDS